VAFMVLTFNSGLAAYLLWGDVACVASVGVTYVLLVPVFVRRFGWWDAGTHRGGSSLISWLYVFIILLSLSLGVFLASRLARTAASSTSTALLVAAAATAALGGLCSYLLHRRSGSKQEHQKMILPLMQESSS